jgi:hypothetical protein
MGGFGMSHGKSHIFGSLVLLALLVVPATAVADGNPGGLLPPDVDIVAAAVAALEEDVQQVELDVDGLDRLTSTLQSNQGGLDLRLSEVEVVLSALETKVVFVTSHAYTGNLGGLDGADAKCQAAAVAGGLSGTFLAWLSTLAGPEIGHPAAGPVHRFVRHAVPYVRTDGVKVADHFGDLVDGTLDQPIDRNEFQTQLLFEHSTWSSTSANGEPVGGTAAGACNNWTTDAVLTQAFFLGTVGATNFGWSAPGFSAATQCTSSHQLLCVEQ